MKKISGPVPPNTSPPPKLFAWIQVAVVPDNSLHIQVVFHMLPYAFPSGRIEPWGLLSL
jgi:hypothetical protein